MIPLQHPTCTAGFSPPAAIIEYGNSGIPGGFLTLTCRISDCLPGPWFEKQLARTPYTSYIHLNIIGKCHDTVNLKPMHYQDCDYSMDPDPHRHKTPHHIEPFRLEPDFRRVNA